jgi:hypothetical protein
MPNSATAVAGNWRPSALNAEKATDLEVTFAKLVVMPCVNSLSIYTLLNNMAYTTYHHGFRMVYVSDNEISKLSACHSCKKLPLENQHANQIQRVNAFLFGRGLLFVPKILPLQIEI